MGIFRCWGGIGGGCTTRLNIRPAAAIQPNSRERGENLPCPAAMRHPSLYFAPRGGYFVGLEAEASRKAPAILNRARRRLVRFRSAEAVDKARSPIPL